MEKVITLTELICNKVITKDLVDECKGEIFSKINKLKYNSKIYYSADDLVTLANFGSTYTVGQMLGNESGGIGFVEVNPAT